MGQEWYLSYDVTVRIKSGYVYSTPCQAHGKRPGKGSHCDDYFDILIWHLSVSYGNMYRSHLSCVIIKCPWAGNLPCWSLSIAQHMACCLTAVGIQKIVLGYAQTNTHGALHMCRCVHTLRDTHVPMHFSVLILADRQVCSIQLRWPPPLSGSTAFPTPGSWDLLLPGFQSTSLEVPLSLLHVPAPPQLALKCLCSA